MSHKDSHQIVVETQEIMDELNRVLKPLYTDGFRRWKDVKDLILMVGQAYLDPLAESPYTRINNRLYSEREVGRIMGVLGRFDEELRGYCRSYLEDGWKLVSVRQPVDKPYLVIELDEGDAPPELSFTQYIHQLEESGHAPDPRVLRVIRDYESQLPPRRVRHYRRCG